MNFILTIRLIIISSFFILSIHPVRMILTVIIYVIFICNYVLKFHPNSWIIFVIILAFIRGIMILFLYISSMTSNNKYFNKNKIRFVILIINLIIIIFILNNSIKIPFGRNYSLTFNLIYYSNWISIFFCLLIIIIIIVFIIKIVYKPFSPLKSF